MEFWKIRPLSICNLEIYTYRKQVMSQKNKSNHFNDTYGKKFDCSAQSIITPGHGILSPWLWRGHVSIGVITGKEA